MAGVFTKKPRCCSKMYIIIEVSTESFWCLREAICRKKWCILRAITLFLVLPAWTKASTAQLRLMHVTTCTVQHYNNNINLSLFVLGTLVWPKGMEIGRGVDSKTGTVCHSSILSPIQTFPTLTHLTLFGSISAFYPSQHVARLRGK